MYHHEALLNHLFKVHSTAFYLKATTSAQIKAAHFDELRLPWSNVVNSIEVLKAHVHYEQSSITQIRHNKCILSKTTPRHRWPRLQSSRINW
jgi:hypothetical protein